jgi:hypothetical protein
MKNEEPVKGNEKLLVKYLGLATQLMVSLGLAVFGGLKLDKWLSFSTPLPLLVLVVMIWQIIKDTSKK